MRVTPLGGAGEVGASCYLLEIAGVRLLIDAGIRVGSGAVGRPLPAFDLLTAAPDAMVVTHAHTDHTGALPLVVPHLGDALIHMTTPSLHLLQILQADAARTHEDAETLGEEDGGKVRYSLEQVEDAIARVQAHAYHAPFTPVASRPDVTVEFAPCGHILGAGMLLIDSPEGRVLWTGDYSVTPQPTIGGVDLDWIRARAAERTIDLIVTEGTYGSAEHPPRDAETERFLGLLERVTRRGGKVLIPAFAVGRAQDIVHIVRAAKAAGRFRDVPVVLDGMVRPVTSVYENIAHQAYPQLGGPLVLLDPALGIVKANNQSRAKLLAEEAEGPAIVISSSGMLVGGRSVQYARAFATGRGNAIFISGYQDAESGGRALLGAKRGRKVRFGDGPKVTLRCEVGRFYTSAHADAAQIQAVVDASGARKVAVVHGDPAALAALKTRLGARRTTVLANGVPLEVKTRRRWRVPEPAGVPVAGEESAGTADALYARRRSLPSDTAVRVLWEALEGEAVRDYADAELAQRLLGPRYTTAEREALAQRLSDNRLYFISGSRIGQRSYRPRPRTDVIEMLLERAVAHQVPLKRGDVVVFSDGSPDLFVAVAAAVHSDRVEAVIPGSSRESFKREWVRCVTGLNIMGLLTSKAPGYVARWLDGVVREARSLPPLDTAALWESADQRLDRRLTLDDALALWYPGRDACFSSAMRVAAGLAVASARTLFTVAEPHWIVARPEADVVARWPFFARLRYVRGLGPGTAVRLNTGVSVYPTGVHFADSFEARTEQGAFTRSNYRRVLLPGEPLPERPAAPSEEESGASATPRAEAPAPRAAGRATPSRRRRRSTTGAPTGAEAAAVTADSAGAAATASAELAAETEAQTAAAERRAAKRAARRAAKRRDQRRRRRAARQEAAREAADMGVEAAGLQGVGASDAPEESPYADA